MLWSQDSDLEIWSETMVSTLCLGSARRLGEGLRLGGEIFRGTLRRSEHWCLSGRARGEDGCLEWSDGDVWQRQERPRHVETPREEAFSIVWP